MPDIIFNGPDGRLEGRYQHGTKPRAPICVVLHPHPLYGGTMNNKVAYTLYRSFAQAGFSVLRFNFRGVGRSEGGWDKGEGELSDAGVALDWLALHNEDASGVWIAGFSFGAWIGAHALMRRPEIEGFVLVAPPADKYDFTFLEPCPCDGLVIQGSADTVVAPEGVTRLVERLNRKKHDVAYEIIEGAGHFFENEMETLQGHVDRYLARRLASA
ncbi:MAG: alpha/beta hydrolase [Proteobacteria bacterium]|nr:alpha/beta hydrolase [Pseudomonadota bacterium]